jgi:hypothetical protein
VCAAQRELMHHRRAEPVAVVPMRQTNPHLRSKAVEPRVQNVTGEDTVTIVVAIMRCTT